MLWPLACFVLHTIFGLAGMKRLVWVLNKGREHLKDYCNSSRAAMGRRRVNFPL